MKMALKRSRLDRLAASASPARPAYVLDGERFLGPDRLDFLNERPARG